MTTTLQALAAAILRTEALMAAETGKTVDMLAIEAVSGSQDATVRGMAFLIYLLMATYPNDAATWAEANKP